jgi:hypothetical protein
MSRSDQQGPAPDVVIRQHSVDHDQKPAASPRWFGTLLGKRILLPPTSFVLFPAAVLLIASLAFVGSVSGGQLGSSTLDVAFSRGVETLTRGRLTVGPLGRSAIVVVLLLLLRRLRLDWMAVRPGPIEVRPLEDATVDDRSVPEGDSRAMSEQSLRRLGVEFREYLASSRLYETTTLPGDVETERIIEVFKGTQPSGRMATLAAVWAYVWPKRAFIVTASLRHRPQAPSCGVSISVRRLPGSAVELESEWSETYEEALQRAAFAVTAHILPMTRACLNPPWSHWYRSESPMPMQLMRHYQRAKRMVSERRYDEALTLYHHALLYDADNVHLRYDIGQLYERLQLYSDALLVYAELMNRLFPKSDRPSNSGGPRRRAGLKISPRSDPFSVRYRYVTTLNSAGRLAMELLEPEWPELIRWIKDDQAGTQSEQHYLRPWRALELIDIRRRLADEIDPIWAAHLSRDLAGSAESGTGLAGALAGKTDPAGAHHSRPLPQNEEEARERTAMRRSAVENYLLNVAVREAELLVQDFRKRSGWRWVRRETSSLTPVALELILLTGRYRLERFEKKRAGERNRRHETWIPSRPLAEALDQAGYQETSSNWLEHYVAACCYALPTEDDKAEVAAHRSYAEAAIRALDRAHRCGDDVEFVTSKRSWLLSGDPDLGGLRHYECFRAFEARIYLHPQPNVPDPAKYELFHYVRVGLERGSNQMEQLWRERARRRGQAVDLRDMEVWFREERRAWEICARLGRFYRQWQTRSAALEGLRRSILIYGGVPTPLPYPEAIRDYNLPGTPDVARARVEGMERLFAFLAQNLGTSSALGGDDIPGTGDNGSRVNKTIINNARSWIKYAEEASRRDAPLLTPDEYVEVCEARAAVWSALRQRVATAARRNESIFDAVTQRLPDPPSAVASSPSGAELRLRSGSTGTVQYDRHQKRDKT